MKTNQLKHFIIITITSLSLLLENCTNRQVSSSGKVDNSNDPTIQNNRTQQNSTVQQAQNNSLQKSGQQNITTNALKNYAQDDSVITIKGDKIHPNRFSTLESEKLSDTKIVYKSFNHEYFGLCSFKGQRNSFLFELADKKGDIDYTIELKNPDDYALQNCYISPDGSLVHFEYIIPFQEENGCIFQSYQNGKLIFQTDSVSSYVFNKNNNVLIYFTINKEGILFYKDFKANKAWNKKINDKLTYTVSVSDNGESIIANSDDKYFAVSNNEKVLWNKESSYFNGSLQLSDLGQYIIVLRPNQLLFYTFESLKLLWEKNSSEITDSNNKVLWHAYGQDYLEFVYISASNFIKVYDYNGKLIKELSLKAGYFEVDQIDEYIDIIVDDKNHFKINQQEFKK